MSIGFLGGLNLISTAKNAKFREKEFVLTFEPILRRHSFGLSGIRIRVLGSPIGGGWGRINNATWIVGESFPFTGLKGRNGDSRGQG
ncbi:MAG: hypothetical protein H6510_14535 [Acidobacteria bacterium]|nr:hypothetical protein [Acidobacteriota bacterium]